MIPKPVTFVFVLEMILQTVSATSYSEFVKRQMSRAEAVLKVFD